MNRIEELKKDIFNILEMLNNLEIKSSNINILNIYNMKVSLENLYSKIDNINNEKEDSND